MARIFVATGFDSTGRTRCDVVASILQAANHEVVIADDLDGESVSASVRERIEGSDALIAILARREELKSGGWMTHPWVIEEATWATAHSLRVLPVVEVGVELGGISGDLHETRFSPGRFEESIPSIITFAATVLGRTADLSRPRPVETRPVYSVVSTSPVEDDWGPDVKRFVESTRASAKKELFHEALGFADQAIALAPSCYRAHNNRGVALTHLHRYDEAEAAFNHVASQFSSRPEVVASALHNEAWLISMRDGQGSDASLRSRKDLYLESLALDNRRIYTRAMAMICMLLLDEEDRALRFLEASMKWEGFVQALREEIQALGGLGMAVANQLPSWLRDAMFPTEGIKSTGETQ